MLYIKKTFSYLKKSFWILALIAAIPAVVMSLFFRPLSFITFIPQYSSTVINSFTDVAWLIFDKYSITHVYPLVIVFILLVLGCSLMLSIIEKHFRVGKLMLKAPIKDVNNSLFPVLKTLAVIVVIYLLWNFILAGITTLLHFIMSGRGVATKLNVAVITAIILGLFLVLLFFCMPALLWAPLMLIFGYSFVDAFIASAKLSGKTPMRLFTGCAFPFLLIIILQYILSFFPIPLFVMIIAAAIYFIFLISYIMAYMMVAAFDLTDMERRDVKKSYV